MPSPFPGMNPYFEHPAFWRGFHTAFLVGLRAAITPLVVPRYFVDVEESLYIDPSGDDELFAIADVAVSAANPDRLSGNGVAAAVVAAPVSARIPRPPRRVKRLTIRDRGRRDVVAVIELLSPSNKDPGTDRAQYERKRVEIVLNGAHLVEIDLLRRGGRMPIRPLPPCDYCVMVARDGDWPRVGAWPFGLRDPIPDVPIPLRAGETEPIVNLRAVLDRTYDEGGYAYELYTRPPDPPLAPADAAWAQEIAERAVPRA